MGFIGLHLPNLKAKFSSECQNFTDALKIHFFKT